MDNKFLCFHFSIELSGESSKELDTKSQGGGPPYENDGGERRTF